MMRTRFFCLIALFLLMISLCAVNVPQIRLTSISLRPSLPARNRLKPIWFWFRAERLR